MFLVLYRHLFQAIEILEITLSLIQVQRLDYVDFSALIERKEGTEAPTRRLTVVYNNFVIDDSDPGDFVTVNSYERKLYGTVLPIINGRYGSDIIDLRPRVTSTS